MLPWLRKPSKNGFGSCHKTKGLAAGQRGSGVQCAQQASWRRTARRPRALGEEDAFFSPWFRGFCQPTAQPCGVVGDLHQPTKTIPSLRCSTKKRERERERERKKRGENLGVRGLAGLPRAPPSCRSSSCCFGICPLVLHLQGVKFLSVVAMNGARKSLRRAMPFFMPRRLPPNQVVAKNTAMSFDRLGPACRLLRWGSLPRNVAIMVVCNPGARRQVGLTSNPVPPD